MKPGLVFGHWSQVRQDLLATIDKFENQELTWRPFEGSMSAGRIMLHIADAEEGWFRYVVTGQRDDWPDDYVLENYPTKAAIKALLTEVHDETVAFLDTLEAGDLQKRIAAPWNDSTFSLGWIIWHVLEHEIHHRGELSLMLGLLGRKGMEV